MPLRFGTQTKASGGLVFGGQDLNSEANVFSAQSGTATLVGGTFNLAGAFITADPGTVSMTGFAALSPTLLAGPGAMSLGGGFVGVGGGSLFAQPGAVSLIGAVAIPVVGIVGQPGALSLVGANAILAVGAFALTASPGVISLVGQQSSVDQALICSPGSITLVGAAALERIAFFAELGAIALGGGAATFSAGTQQAVVADRGILNLIGSQMLSTETMLLQPGALSVVGGAMLGTPSVLAERGALSIFGGNAIFDTDVILDGQPGQLLLTGAPAVLGLIHVHSPGALTIVGGQALFSAQGAAVFADPGALLLSGSDITLTVSTGFVIEGVEYHIEVGQVKLAPRYRGRLSFGPPKGRSIRRLH